MGRLVRQLQSVWERVRCFLAQDVWRPQDFVTHRSYGFVLKQVRVVILLLRNFVQDNLLLRAAALTFATLFAIVPLLAVMFFLIQQFNLEEGLYTFLTRKIEQTLAPVAGQPPHQAPNALDLKHEIIRVLFQGVAQQPAAPGDVPLANPVEELVKYAQEGANSMTVTVAGVLFLIATVFGLLMNVESSFNQIWGLKRSRSVYRMSANYLKVILLLPFVTAGALAATAAVESAAVSEYLGPLTLALRGSKHVLIWLVFTAIYFTVPNTRVPLRYALLGGVIAGTLWSLASLAYVKFQFGLSNYSLLYSTFAQVPVLLMWIYVSWLILLFGGELTFAYQNETTFAMERFAQGASHAYREALGVRTMLELARNFDAGHPPLAAEQCAEAWHVSLRLLNDTLDQLEAAGLVMRCAGKSPAYQPARSIDKITLGQVVTALREAGADPSSLRHDEWLRPLLERINGAHDSIMSASLASVVQGLPPAAADASAARPA